MLNVLTPPAASDVESSGVSGAIRTIGSSTASQGGRTRIPREIVHPQSRRPHDLSQPLTVEHPVSKLKGSQNAAQVEGQASTAAALGRSAATDSVQSDAAGRLAASEVSRGPGK